MNDALKKTKDARYLDSSDQDQNIWESYPRLNGEIRSFPIPCFSNIYLVSCTLV